jgi:hypothetical protein
MTDIYHDAAKTLLASLPADATPGRYRSSPGFMSETIVRCREPHDDITVGAQVVGYCEHTETRALLAAAPALRDALRATLEEVERLRGENSKLRDVLGWVETQCPGKCAGVCFDALSGEHRRETPCWPDLETVLDDLDVADIERGEHRREETK